MGKPSKDSLEKANAEIALFEQWFVREGAEPLAKFEAAILRTYLVAKEEGRFTSSSAREGASRVESVDVFVLPLEDS